MSKTYADPILDSAARAALECAQACRRCAAACRALVGAVA